MLGKIILLALFSTSAFAIETNLYDEFMDECMAINGNQLTCHRSVKMQVLSDPRTTGDFLSCIDYGHSAVSLETEAGCLRDISQI
jgi:hypothetical protein